MKAMSDKSFQCTEEVRVGPKIFRDEMQALYDKHRKVSLLFKVHQNTHSCVKNEVI